MNDDASDRMDFWNAILIAIVTVCAALVAWRASIAADAAGDNDYDGLRAVVNVEEATTMGTVEAYTHAQAYANYRRYEEMASSLADEEEEASGREASELARKRRDAEVMVDEKLKMFPNKFMERDGKSGQNSYNTRREIGQYVANIGRTKDMQSEEHFQDAERFRTKSEKLLMGVVFLSISLVFLTLVEAFEGGSRKLCFVLGLLLAIGGLGYSVAIEVAKNV
ncbi:hypothetical protein JST97_17970 [bacterium]|nr:hypothetical protein [bacterium]